MIDEYLQTGLFDASLHFKISPTPALCKLLGSVFFLSLSVPPSFAVLLYGHAEGYTGVQMPSFQVCLFSSGREACCWSLGWDVPPGLVWDALQLSSAARSIAGTVMNLFPFVISQTIRMLLNLFWSPKAGLLVDICLLWSYDLYDPQVVPSLRKPSVTNLRALQSAKGAGQGKSGQQMSLRIFLCRHHSPSSVFLVELPETGLGGLWETLNLTSLPLLCKCYSPECIALWCWGFYKPQPKRRERFRKIKGKDGSSFVSSEHFMSICSLWANEAMSLIQYLRSLLIGKIMNIAGILLRFARENW